MYITRVQTQPSFQSNNYRFVSQQAQKNIADLVTRMNAETVYKEHGGMFSSSILN